LAKPAPKVKARGVALVGADTLLGREIEEVIEARNMAIAVSSFAATGEGNFGEQEGEAVYVEPLEARSLEHLQAVIVAGSEEGALKAYNLVKAAGGYPPIIDCTGDLDTQPEARIVAPLLGAPGPTLDWLLVAAHPAASALALVLVRLARRKPIRQAIANIFEPASERGKRGIAALHQQTTSLLSFKSIEKDVFDTQLSFNLLSQYGEDAPLKLSSIEQRIERHTATVLSRVQPPTPIPMPSLRLLQAPVFHGYSISLWVEFDENVQAGEMGESLACAQIEIRNQQEEAPHSIGAASQSGLIAGDIRVDHNNPHAAWFWIVGDNLRLTADAAADLLTSLELKPQ
jgi:aspartate-semialdehyde dehydrogenase